MSSRLFIVVVVSLFIFLTTAILIQYAKGYRPDPQTGNLKATGLLVSTSEPTGAKVFINGELKTATDDTFNLDPGTYLVEIKKAGFIPWTKTLTVEKELVTQTDALLFPLTPNLQSITNSGALNPNLSLSGTKLIYSIPEASNSAQIKPASAIPTSSPEAGLWLMELTNLPLGFNQEPKQLVISEPNSKLVWAEAQFIWSPDSREILAVFYADIEPGKVQNKKQLTANSQQLTAAFLINTSTTGLTNNKLVDVTNKAKDILLDWQTELDKNLLEKIDKLPPDLAVSLGKVAKDLKFSPDETKLLYTATDSVKLADEYITPLPAASTQKQSRDLQPNHTYLYDIKEDRNFEILNEEATTKINACINPKQGESTVRPTANSQQLTAYSSYCPKISWFPTSRHLIYFNDQKISVMEYDSTNHYVIYAGPIENNYVFTHPSPSKLLIVTNLNPEAFPLPNIYTLSLR